MKVPDFFCFDVTGIEFDVVVSDATVVVRAALVAHLEREFVVEKEPVVVEKQQFVMLVVAVVVVVVTVVVVV